MNGPKEPKASKLESDIEQERLNAEKEATWRIGFEAMANDPESTSVEYAFPAQAEVVLGE